MQVRSGCGLVSIWGRRRLSSSGWQATGANCTSTVYRRHEVTTTGTIRAIKEGVEQIERGLRRSGTVGVGIPGTISRITHTVKNANSTWLNGKPFDKDLSIALDREVRCANDANCLAVSEATDGAGA